ncbi:MAG: hypothetical protein AMXMBFR36_07490 [Acidobacteriota bacterium]
MSESNANPPADPLELLLEGVRRLLAGLDAGEHGLAALVEGLARATGSSGAALHPLETSGVRARLSAPVAAWRATNGATAVPELDAATLGALTRGESTSADGVRLAPVPIGEALSWVLVLETGRDAPAWIERDERRLRAAAALAAAALQQRSGAAELEQSEAKYREMFENATELFWSIDLDGRFTSVNRAFTELLGYGHDEIVGHPWEEFIPEPDQREIVRTAMREKLDRKREQTRYEVRMIKKSGGFVPVEVSSRVVSRDGRPTGIHGVGRDVSEQRRLEEQLRQAVKMEAVGRLAGGIAHEFSHLVAAISGYGERVLARLKASDPLRSEVTEILRAGERAADLTRELLAFGRQQTARPARFELNDFLQQRLPTLRRIVSEEVVVVDLTEDRVGRIHADPGLLEQLLVSLFVNARDAMPEGGRIEISTATAEAEEIRRRGVQNVPHPTYVHLAIRDSGEGMDPVAMNRIFEPFFTTRERGRGSGLGLSTVYGIVKQCEGFIFADSHPGQGSVFHVFLPQVEPPGRRRPSSGEIRIASLAPPVAARPELVLLVEDEDLIRNLAEQILSDRGYHVVAAANASEALEVVSRLDRELDLLVTDVVMPGLSGLDLAQRLQRRSPRLRILFMSGYADSPLLRAGLAQGGAAFLQKPFSADALERRVRELLDSPPPTV